MSVYKYRAKKGPNEIIEGKVDAASEKEALEKISQLGYFPIYLELEGEYFKEENKVKAKKVGKIKSHQITIFTRELSSLIKAGVPILTSLNIIQEQTENYSLKVVIQNIYELVKKGNSLYYAFSQYPKLFSPLYLALLKAGEDSATLSETLLRISEYRLKQEEFFSKIRTALAYPILMLIVGILTLIFMFTFVIPRLRNIFINLGGNLPLPTQILLRISELLQKGWFWLGLILVVLILRLYIKKESSKFSLSIFKLKLPIFGKLVLKSELSRFSRTLELLLKNGIPILRALELSIDVLNNEVLKIDLRKSYKELERGGSFGKTLKKSIFFPPFVSNLIIVGEESGKLDQALGEIAYTYERDTEETLKIISNILEPLMIIVMGSIVGFIVISMLLPIFEINLLAR